MTLEQRKGKERKARKETGVAGSEERWTRTVRELTGKGVGAFGM